MFHAIFHSFLNRFFAGTACAFCLADFGDERTVFVERSASFRYAFVFAFNH
jgi:hypothetical protein